jgi:hypothetical protein
MARRSGLSSVGCSSIGLGAEDPEGRYGVPEVVVETEAEAVTVTVVDPVVGMVAGMILHSSDPVAFALGESMT